MAGAANHRSTDERFSVSWSKLGIIQTLPSKPHTLSKKIMSVSISVGVDVGVRVETDVVISSVLALLRLGVNNPIETSSDVDTGQIHSKRSSKSMMRSLFLIGSD